jgi:hypothetical protein
MKQPKTFCCLLRESMLIQYRKRVVCSEIHTKYTNTQCGQKMETFKVNYIVGMNVELFLCRNKNAVKEFSRVAHAQQKNFIC